MQGFFIGLGFLIDLNLRYLAIGQENLRNYVLKVLSVN